MMMMIDDDDDGWLMMMMIDDDWWWWWWWWCVRFDKAVAVQLRAVLCRCTSDVSPPLYWHAGSIQTTKQHYMMQDVNEVGHGSQKNAANQSFTVAPPGHWRSLQRPSAGCPSGETFLSLVPSFLDFLLFCLILQLMLTFFSTWCAYPPDGYSYRESEHHLKLIEVECINWNPGRKRHFIFLGYAAYIRVFLFFFRVFVFKPMVLREGADPIHVVSAWSQDVKFRVGNSCPTIK